MVAVLQRCWKFKYLFHDWEKPWLMLIWRDYKRVQRWHRLHNNHHLEYRKGIEKIDWEAWALDNECSRFTKEASPLTALEWLQKHIAEMGPRTAELALRGIMSANLVHRVDQKDIKELFSKATGPETFTI